MGIDIEPGVPFYLRWTRLFPLGRSGNIPISASLANGTDLELVLLKYLLNTLPKSCYLTEKRSLLLSEALSKQQQLTRYEEKFEISSMRTL